MSTPTAHPPTITARSALWASAFVLLALVLVQLGRAPRASFPLDLATEARAGVVSQVGAYTILTSEAGNEDILVVLDGRTEDLLVYRMDQEGLALLQKMALPRVFTEARLRAAGGHK